tara:strand:- start:46 stop:954 length:909 start_codon:yes stop_codon:yes gene_type:complete
MAKLKKSQQSLKNWTAQDWGNVSGKKGDRYLPKSVRDSLTPAQKAAENRKKREATRKGKPSAKYTKELARKVRNAESGMMVPADMSRLKKRDVNSKLVKRFNQGGLNEKSDMLKRLKKGISRVESLDGVLMINPESTATGKYGQRFSELEELNLPGPTRMSKLTRDDFAKDIALQDRLFEKRFEGTMKKDVPGLYRNAIELSKEYESVIGDKFTKDEVAALSHFLGRQGARKYFGNVLRDGKSLEEVFPTKYGPNKEQNNKTPEEYIKKYREAFLDEPMRLPITKPEELQNKSFDFIKPQNM